MYFLFSGEGPTDMGAGTGAGSICEGDEYTCGPMTVIVDQIVESHPAHRYSPLDSGCCGWVSWMVTRLPNGSAKWFETERSIGCGSS